jgi:hypothetical protein
MQGFLFLHASPVHHGTRERWPSRNSVVGLTRSVEPKLQLPGAAATELRKAVAYRGNSTVDSLLTLGRAASRLGGHVETQPLRRGQFSRRSRRGRPIRRLGRDGVDRLLEAELQGPRRARALLLRVGLVSMRCQPGGLLRQRCGCFGRTACMGVCSCLLEDRPLALLATATPAVHHRCITRAAFVGVLRCITRFGNGLRSSLQDGQIHPSQPLG